MSDTVLCVLETFLPLNHKDNIVRQMLLRSKEIGATVLISGLKPHVGLHAEHEAYLKKKFPPLFVIIIVLVVVVRTVNIDLPSQKILSIKYSTTKCRH